MRAKAFFYHYNKPVSRAEKRPVISLHYDGVCHLLDGIDVRVPTISKFNKRQPFFVMKGKAKNVSIQDKIAIIE